MTTWMVKLKRTRFNWDTKTLGRGYLKLTQDERELTCSILRHQHNPDPDGSLKYPGIHPVALPFIRRADVISALMSIAVVEKLDVEGMPFKAGATKALYKLSKFRWLQVKLLGAPNIVYDKDSNTLIVTF